MKKAGGTYFASGIYYARLARSLGRKSIPLPTCTTEEQAALRTDVVARVARALLKIGRKDLALTFAEKAATADSPKRLAAIEQAVADVCSGAVSLERPVEGVTFQEHAKSIANGTLAAKHPDRVKARDVGTGTKDQGRLAKYINPMIGHLPVVSITLTHIDHVMSELPKHLSPASRRHIGQIMYRAMKLAAYPCRLITASPIPAGWLPRIPKGKAYGWIYPDEEALLMACPRVPLATRMLYGFLVREGCREMEAVNAEAHDFDLERGVFNLDENKTRSPRMWALDPSTVAALKLWMKHPARGRSRYMFSQPDGQHVETRHFAETFRKDLIAAGVTREALHASTESRMQIRAHDLRATFVTLAFAGGKNEAWIGDRTGHTSSIMLNRYRRSARMVAELHLGTIRPFDEAVPELGKTDQYAPSSQIDAVPNVAKAAEITGFDASGNATTNLKSLAARRSGSTPEGATNHAESQRKQPGRANRKAAKTQSFTGQLLAAGGSIPHPPAEAEVRPDPVVASLSASIQAASAAGRWDVVVLLGKELESRQRDRAGVVDLAAERRKRGER